jgi:hypothetical protein
VVLLGLTALAAGVALDGGSCGGMLIVPLLLRSHAYLTKSGPELQCGVERYYILTECGHETAMFSGRTIYGLGPLQVPTDIGSGKVGVGEIPIIFYQVPLQTRMKAL